MTEGQRRALDELLPRWGVDFTPAPIRQVALFGRIAPLVVEIGFGAGEALAARAAAHPDQDHLGIEVHRPGAGRLLLELEKLGLTNVRISTHDAVEVLSQQIEAGALDRVLLFFPDPWPKKRHHKRRIVQPGFVGLVASRLKPGGCFHLATDWAPYAEQMREVLDACPTLRNAHPGWAPRPAERPLTRFERRGERLGHQVFDLEYLRLAAR